MYSGYGLPMRKMIGLGGYTMPGDINAGVGVPMMDAAPPEMTAPEQDWLGRPLRSRFIGLGRRPGEMSWQSGSNPYGPYTPKY